MTGIVSRQVFRHELQILRSTAVDPATVTDWNVTPAADGTDSVVATVRGRVSPVSTQEQAELSDAGAIAGEYRALIWPMDVHESDRIRRIDTDETFEIRAKRDLGGAAKLLQLELHKVTA